MLYGRDEDVSRLLGLEHARNSHQRRQRSRQDERSLRILSPASMKSRRGPCGRLHTRQRRFRPVCLEPWACAAALIAQDEGTARRLCAACWSKEVGDSPVPRPTRSDWQQRGLYSPLSVIG